MHVLHVRPGQEIAVVRKDLLFRFDIAPAGDQRVDIWFYIPARDDHGEVVPVDTSDLKSVAVGETCATGYEGQDAGDDVEGDVDITVTAFENGTYCAHVTTPDGWDVIARPDNQTL
jgi:hypothetical protein